MKTARHIKSMLLTAVLLPALLSSCADRSLMSRLTELDEAMDEHSDSVYYELSGMKGRAVAEGKTGAYHALLLSIAQTKVGIVPSSDSLVRKAYDYYLVGKDGRNRMRSTFYLGNYYYQTGDYVQAAVFLTYAEEQAREEEDHFFIAMSCRWLGLIYQEYSMASRAEEYLANTVEEFGLAGKETHRVYALQALGHLYLHTGQRDKAESLFLQIKSGSPNQGYDYMTAAVDKELAVLYAFQNKPIQAINLFCKVEKSFPALLGAYEYVVMGKAYSIAGEPEKAKKCFNYSRENTGKDNEEYFLHLTESEMAAYKVILKKRIALYNWRQ